MNTFTRSENKHKFAASDKSSLGVATLRNFDWSLVQSFLAVLEAGSLLGASRRLKAGQPTVGRHIAELERQLGVVLFERTGRGLLPNSSALLLAESARQMEAGALQIAHALSGQQLQLQGAVRITASVPVAVMLLPPVLVELRETFPDIQIELVSSNQISNLLRREADIAIRMVRPQQTSLIARKMGDVSLGAFAHGDYLKRHGIPRKPADLLKHDLIGGDSDGSILRGFAAMGYPARPELFALRTDDFIVQLQAVRAGYGVGFLASYMTRFAPELVAVLPDALQIEPLPMWLTVHREIRTNRRIRAVFDFLAEALPQAIQWS